MMQRNLSTATVTQNSANEAHADPVAYSRVEGPPLILGYLSDSKETVSALAIGAVSRHTMKHLL